MTWTDQVILAVRCGRCMELTAYRLVDGKPQVDHCAACGKPFDDPGELADTITNCDGKIRQEEIFWVTAQELIDLEPGWDGYGAKALRPETLFLAEKLAKAIVGAGLPWPQIVPGTHGDAQLEWHTEEYEIELHIGE